MRVKQNKKNNHTNKWMGREKLKQQKIDGFVYIVFRYACVISIYYKHIHIHLFHVRLSAVCEFFESFHKAVILNENTEKKRKLEEPPFGENDLDAINKTFWLLNDTRFWHAIISQFSLFLQKKKMSFLCAQFSHKENTAKCY